MRDAYFLSQNAKPQNVKVAVCDAYLKIKKYKDTSKVFRSRVVNGTPLERQPISSRHFGMV